MTANAAGGAVIAVAVWWFTSTPPQVQAVPTPVVVRSPVTAPAELATPQVVKSGVGAERAPTTGERKTPQGPRRIVRPSVPIDSPALVPPQRTVPNGKLEVDDWAGRALTPKS
jgi:hypothetical protein